MSNNANKTDISNEKYVIFASHYPVMTVKGILNLFNVGFKELEGRYNNVDETSFIVNMRDKELIHDLIAEQESILELSEIQPNGLRKAKLVFKDGTETNLGDMTQVTEIKAKASNAYTFDGQSYFVAG